jgi:lipopolysaccharide transport system ATP-binding protein
MSDIALKIEDVSKLYRLGLVSTGTFIHDFQRWVHRIQGKEDPFMKVGQVNDRTKKAESDFVWALKDIDFEVKKGETLGIIGRNGAGKSTLLKLLSRVTQPTTGSIKVNGRIASLLEVGTGFHPELTGRDNIFLNGAILGMRHSEIKKKFDEIVAFSGVERYIDTPVKRYSSGMYVRLAFAVAAHLESEILIIDEVLAVGDADFQRKCLGKMDQVAKGEGRTVLFVSHNIAAVKSLCSQGLVIEHGMKAFQGGVSQAVSYYLKGGSDVQHYRNFDFITHPNFTLNSINVHHLDESRSEILDENKDIHFTVECDVKSQDISHLTFHLYDETGEPVFSFASTQLPMELGRNELTCVFPALFLQTGTFYVSLYVVTKDNKCLIIEKDVISFLVSDGGRDFGAYMGREPGLIRPHFNWYSGR